MRRTIALMLSLLAPLAVSLAVVAPASAADDSFDHVWDRAPGGERYVALGDSFTSGPGIAPQRGRCSRSVNNFPSLFAAELDATLPGGLNSFVDASCGGAQTKDLWAAQNLAAGLTNDRQLDAVTPDTTLVTFGTIGGNDIGLVGLAQSCISKPCTPAPGVDPYATKFADVRVALTQGIVDVKALAPDARIMVMGYSTYVPPRGCPEAFAGLITADSFDYLQSQIDRLSDLLATIADEQGVDFVDQREIPGAADHTVCAEPTKQWIRALSTYEDGATFHPSACGMSATAQHLLRTYEELNSLPVTAFDSSCISKGPVVAPPVDVKPPVVDVKPPPAQVMLPIGVATPAEVRQHNIALLKASAAQLKVKTSCGNGKATLRLSGTSAAVAKVRFSVGNKQVAKSTKAPYKVTVAKAQFRGKGALKARVLLEGDSINLTKVIRAKRPACVR